MYGWILAYIYTGQDLAWDNLDSSDAMWDW